MRARPLPVITRAVPLLGLALFSALCAASSDRHSSEHVATLEARASKTRLEKQFSEIAKSEIAKARAERSSLISLPRKRESAKTRKMVRHFQREAKFVRRALKRRIRKVRKQEQKDSVSLTEKAHAAVMALFHQEQANILQRTATTPSADPFKEDEDELMPFLTSDPLEESGPPVGRMTILDEAVDEAERRASNAKVHPMDARAYQKVADLIMKGSSSKTGEQLEVMRVSNNVLTRKKAHAAMQLMIFQAYNAVMGHDGNAHRRAFLCQKAVKNALDTVTLPAATKEQRTRLCKRKLFAAQNKLRIEKAVNDALKKESKEDTLNFSRTQTCDAARRSKQHLIIAKIEVKAVFKACPDMEIDAESRGTAHVRRQINKDIATYMAKELSKAEARVPNSVLTNKNDPANLAEKAIMQRAREAWQDVTNFGIGNGGPTKPRPSRPTVAVSSADLPSHVQKRKLKATVLAQKRNADAKQHKVVKVVTKVSTASSTATAKKTAAAKGAKIAGQRANKP